MPYALIPDGYSLKKVTKLQKQAVNDKRRHDNVVAFLSNENTPVLIGGAGVVALTGLLGKIFTDINLTETQESKLKESFVLSFQTSPVFGPAFLFAEAAGKADKSVLEDWWTIITKGG